MATKEKLVRNKKKFKHIGNNEENGFAKVKDLKKNKKLKQLKKKRLIIRNLSFKVTEKELKKIFSEFGEVLDVRIPVNEAGKKRGFAFVQFKDTKCLIKAMKKLNFQEIHGRPIAIDFAVDKTTYLSRLSQSTSEPKKECLKHEIKSESETEHSEDESMNVKNKPKDTSYTNVEIDDNDAQKKAFLKEFHADDDDDDDEGENSEDEQTAESSEDEECDHSDEDEDNRSDIGTKSYKKKKSDDVSEGKTVFIRNISFKNTEEDLLEAVKEYGETVYCLFCNDPVTGHFKGTAFVKFKEKESAEKLIEASSKEPGILLDGRKLLCSNAISREELSKMTNNSEKHKDRRNLRLLKCGLVAYGSKESEGVSQADMAKRAQLEAVKKQKLRNVNFFVSDKRLICHNIPKNINDKDLYRLFKKAGGEGAVVKEARIMRDFKKTDAAGNPLSRGFAFIAFSEHEHALKALQELNNNPNIFTANKRPIVEFSVENKVALLSQEKRREKIKMQNKRRMEMSNNQMSQVDTNQQSPETKFRKQKNQNKRKQVNVNSPVDETVSPKRKKKQNRKMKKEKQNAARKNEIAALTKMYKEKIKNKLS